MQTASSFTHPFIHSFIHAFILSYINSSIYPSTNPLVMPAPHFCKPYQGVPCDLTAAGTAVSIPGRCKHDSRCNELRCSAHCKCARMGWRTGRNMSRLAQAKAKAHAKPAPEPSQNSKRAWPHKDLLKKTLAPLGLRTL